MTFVHLFARRLLYLAAVEDLVAVDDVILRQWRRQHEHHTVSGARALGDVDDGRVWRCEDTERQHEDTTRTVIETSWRHDEYRH